MLEDVALGQVQWTSYAAEAQADAVRSAFRALADDPSLLQGSAVLQAFYDSLAQQCYGRLALAQKALEAGDAPTAASLLAQVVNPNPATQNLRTVLGIEAANTLAGQDTLSPADSLALAPIAALCRQQGGEAVHHARGILARSGHAPQLLPAWLFADQDCGYNANAPKRTAELEAINQELLNRREMRVGVRPNPTHSSLWIEVTDIEPGTTTELQLLDVTGRSVLRTNATLGTTQLDVSSLPSGLYFLRARHSTGGVLTEHVLIQR
jgi:hypothetical protein